MDKDLKNIGQWLQERRKAKNITLIELGQTAALTQASLSKIENDLSAITLFSLIRIFKALGLSFTSLFSEGLIPGNLPLPSIYYRSQEKEFEYPTFNLGDVENFVHFILHRGEAEKVINKWLKKFIEDNTDWEPETIRVLLDEARNLLTILHESRFEGSVYAKIGYPLNFEIDKLRRIFLSGGALILQDIGTYIHNSRIAMGMSKNEVAHKIGVTQPSLSRFETNLSERTRFVDIFNLDQALNAEGELISFSWRVGELYLGTTRIVVKNLFVSPYSEYESDWIEKFVILSRMYQNLGLDKEMKEFIQEVRNIAVPYPSKTLES